MKRAAWLLVLLACQPEAPKHPVILRVNSAQAGELTTQGRQSVFFAAGGDSQRLMLGVYPTGRHGPLAVIQPIANGHRHDAIDDPNGRLVARLISYDTIPYPKLNLTAYDTVYWYVYPDTGDADYRSVLVSTRTQTVMLAPLTLHAHDAPRRAREALARWAWSDDDETACVVCTWVDWCRIQ